MTTRSAKVVLELLVDKYIQNAKRASEATKTVGEEAEKAGKKTDKATEQATAELAKLAQKHQEAAKAAGLQYNSSGQLVDGNKRVLNSAQATAHGLDAFSEAVYKTGYEAEQAAERQARAAAKQAAAVEKTGQMLTTFGTVSVAALGASAKAAMDWESAWAGVTKTVDGTPEQMADIESGLRGLAKTLPSTHTEIAAVAEAAGQLGVKREDILKFTKTMIDLGETTNLTADEAATDIAQIANVMGTSGEDIDNFGATLVALGNDGASTEKEILSMAQRIAGAGKLVGASEADVLALSNTLASMGVKAELGGGVATRALLKVYGAVKEGGGALDSFAKTAGVSSEDFANAFSTSPVAALEMFTKGLGRVKDEGGNVVQALRDVGMKGTEELQVMLALAGAGDLLSDSLKLGAEAWEENTALIEEATKRYATTESKVKVAWNNIKDAAIDAGAVILPVIAGVAESVSGLAQTFGSMPAPVQGAITGIGGVAGAAALAGGGLMLLLPKVRDGITAFKDLDTKADGTSRGLGKVGKAAGVAAGLFVGFEVLRSIGNSMSDSAVSTQEMTQSLIGLGKAKDSVDTKFKEIAADVDYSGIENAGDALKKLMGGNIWDDLSNFNSTVLGLDNGMTKISNGFAAVDQSIAGAVSSGNMDMAAKGFKSIADSASEKGISLEDTAKRFPNYLNALRDLANQSKVNVSDANLLKWAMGELPPEMEAAAAGGDKAAQALLGTGDAASQAAALTEEIIDALEEVGLAADGSVADIEAWTATLFAAGLRSLSASDAAIGYQASIDAMTESVIANGKTLDINTEQGRNNQTAYNNIAKAAMAAMTATAEETFATQGATAAQEGLQAGLWQSYKDLLVAADQLGITGTAADEMARKALGIPKEIPIDTWVNDKATAELERIKGKAQELDGTTANIWVNTHHTDSYERRVEEAGGNEPTGGGLYGSDRRAEGGAIYGPGTSTSDTAGLFRLSNGEHVLDAADVAKMGGQQAVYKFRANLQAGTPYPGRAAGGGIGRHTAAGELMASNPASISRSTTIDLGGITINGATDPDAVRRGVVDDIKYLLGGQGVRLGG